MEMEISGSRQKPSTIQKTLSVRPRRTLALLSPRLTTAEQGGVPRPQRRVPLRPTPPQHFASRELGVLV